MKTYLIFNLIGNLFYRLNGGLNGLDKKNWLNRLMYWAWGKSYSLEDKVNRKSRRVNDA